MNKELELEAEEYAKTDWGVNHKILSEDSYDFKRVEISKQDFIAGATSEAAKDYWYKQFQKQKLEFAMSMLNRAKDLDLKTVYLELQQKLKEYENI